MRIIKPSAAKLPNNGLETCVDLIVRGARICYASTIKGNEEKTLRHLITNGHMSPFAHGIIHYPLHTLNNLMRDKTENRILMNALSSKYTLIGDLYGTLCATINCRTLIETIINMQVKNELLTEKDDTYTIFMELLERSKYIAYIQDFEKEPVRFMTVEIDTNLAVGRELERHISYMLYYNEQSTRYCNFTKDKFSNSVAFLEPHWYSEDQVRAKEWEEDCITHENMYFRRLNNGWNLDDARKCLPLETHTKIMITANINAWRHLMEQRLYEKTGKVDPDMLRCANLINSVIYYGTKQD